MGYPEGVMWCASLLALSLAAPSSVLVVDGLGIGSLSGGKWTPFSPNPKARRMPALNFARIDLIKSVPGRTRQQLKFADDGAIGWFLSYNASNRGVLWSGPTPRPLKATLINPKNEVYRRALLKYVESRGVIEPKLVTFKGVQVDLDGDGQQEVLLAGGSRTHDALVMTTASGASVEDFSVVLLRAVSNGKVVEIPLGMTELTENSLNGVYRLMAVTNLDSDRFAEIIITGDYYEGQSATVFRYAKGKLTKLVENEAGV